MDGCDSRTLYCTMMSHKFDGWGRDAPRSFPSHSLRGNATGLQILTSLRYGRNNTTSIGGGISQLPTQGHYQRAGKINKPKPIPFKESLTNFMRDLLKPHWKRGKISKNDHKEILRRAVHKVIESIEESKIPKEKEVQEYLLRSKDKLSKLIQAYVDRYAKKH